MTLHTTYFGSVNWYRQLVSAEGDVYIDACENYVKQTSRNRCEIATANGKQILTVPVTTKVQEVQKFKGVQKFKEVLRTESSGEQARSTVPVNFPVLVKNVLVSEHGNWRHQHWEALKSAYGMSPFFDYYQDDIRPFFDEVVFRANNWQKLFDYNLAIMRKMLDLIGVKKEVRLTSPTPTPPQGERVVHVPINVPVHYYQTFQKRHGFIPNLSILDLLFNEGPEAILYLR